MATKRSRAGGRKVIRIPSLEHGTWLSLLGAALLVNEVVFHHQNINSTVLLAACALLGVPLPIAADRARGDDDK